MPRQSSPGRSSKVIKDMWNQFRTFYWNVCSVDEHPEMQNLSIYADAAYQRFISWFGLPPDPQWKYEIVTALCASTIFDPFRCIYIIALQGTYASPEQSYASLAHEIYHRVTMRCPGLRRSVWVDEMVAYLATQEFLIEQGMDHFAQSKSQRLRHQPKRLSMAQLKRIRRRPNFLGLFGPAYPASFPATIAVLGETLEAMVGWEPICRMVHCPTWAAWLELLPEGLRREVSRLLELD